VINYITSIKP